MATTLKEKARFVATTIFPHGVFWSWNAIFFCIIYIMLLPEILWPLVRATIDGPVPWDFTLFTLVLLAIPLFCVIFGALFFRRQPGKLLGLFYGIEAPLLLLGTCRLFLVREMTLGVAQLLITFNVAAFFYLYELLQGYREKRFTATVQMIGHTILLLTGLYLGTLLTFYVVPGLYAFLEAFFSFGWVRTLLNDMRRIHGPEVLFAPFAFLTFGFTALLFFGAPIAWVALSVRSFRRIFAAFAQQFGRARATIIAVSTGIALVAIFLLCNRQPQSAAFALLKNTPTSDGERQQLLNQEGQIRSGLLNAYLSPFRYLSSVVENDHIEDIYRKTFHLNGTWIPFAAQLAYNGLARPVLFQGHNMLQDQAKAEALYEQFFDTPLQRGERDAVLRSLEATWSSQQREAGLINQGQRKVWLARQEVTTQAHGDWAEIELHEVYENQTYDQQEIFYYFSLPASAAVTGLWLGDSDDRKQRFAYTVAPRGAAQKVYKQEVQRRTDPALLEQIGPRQYRLRAFPIPPRQWGKWKTAPQFHLWLTYKTLATRDGYPLPVLGERRNVYWSLLSKRTVDGKTERFGSAWLPEKVGVGTALSAHEVTLPEGVVVRAVPLKDSDIPLFTQRAIAVVLDRSKSMQRVDAEVKQSLAYLREVSEGPLRNDVDYYLTSSPYRGEAPQRIDESSGLGPSATLFYGAQTTRELLLQFDALKKDKHYDAILVLTDDGSLDLATDKGPNLITAAPIYMVHLGGRLAPGYDDTTLAALQKSGGGVALSVAEALRSLSLLSGPPKANSAAEVASYDEGLLWTVEPAAAGATPTVDDGFSALAARQAILHRTRQAQLGSLDVLDALHAMAQHYSVVSAYSSMLVLVNDQQRELLKRASEEKDRFERQVEDGKENLAPPKNPLHISGAPEPHEWLLLLCAATVLFWAHRRQRRVAAA